MIASAIRELCRSDIDDALTCARWNLVNKAHKVLITIAEAHATAYTTLEERSRTREVEGNHALILVPDVHHAVELIVTRAYIIYIKQSIPISIELSKCLVYLGSGVELCNECVSLILVDNLRS